MEVEIDIQQEKVEILNRYRGLLRSLGQRIDAADRKLIRKAFDVANEAHKGVRRKSGEPYIYHPIAVARIVSSEIGLGATSVICALLHDTVEDTDITLTDIKGMFGDKYAQIIDGLTKISEVTDNTSVSLQAENYRKILLTLSDDIRVILIKIADRLHNMRTMDSMNRNKQLKIASETMYLYAPLAHRLGLYSIKSELEDLGLKYTEPEAYDDIASKLKKTQAVRARFINQFSIPIRSALNDMGMKFKIKARTKSVHAILNKMKTKHVEFEEVYDLFALRIIIDTTPENEKADCWKVYSVVTDSYLPKPDRLRDWISNPKSNGYESLHTTVMSPKGRWVEVQIRSKRMDDVAEKGLASHWNYKNGEADSTMDSWLKSIRELLENPEPNALDFIDDFKLNLFSQEVTVFTPKGELRSLPYGATALDFAFDIHSQIGERCLGAKVNHNLVPLSYQLKNGDQVEIITSSKQRPQEEWLSYVVTAKAKSKIKDGLKGGRRKFSSLGKTALEKKFKQLKVTFNSANINELLALFNVTNETELFYQIGKEKVNLSILNKIDIEGGKFVIKRHRKKGIKSSLSKLLGLGAKGSEDLVLEDMVGKYEYQLSKCCNPIAGDEIFGFAVVGEGIHIHKVNCPNAIELLSNHAYRVIRAKWNREHKIEFLTGLKVTGIDSVGLVNRITRIISDELDVNMRSLNFESNDGVFEGKIMVFIHNINHLYELMDKLMVAEGVISVKRIEAS